MPLSTPADREPMHRRTIDMRGYRRADGLFDIEGHLLDTKAYGFDNEEKGWLEPGTPLHGMWIRLTIDEDLLIRECEAASDHTPYAICPQAAPNFARLAGLKIGPGFNRAVQERVGGVLGCQLGDAVPFGVPEVGVHDDDALEAPAARACSTTTSRLACESFPALELTSITS